MGVTLPLLRQGLFYVPFILTLPRFFGTTGLYLCQPAADALTLLVCLLLIRPMRRLIDSSMAGSAGSRPQAAACSDPGAALCRARFLSRGPALWLTSAVWGI